ncbi:MAG: hypothetical protein A2007_01140 [Verrucomicrobia bacterium GWC2_42_7]|nr:MAG: hypothetical protein A2007_01140 [Verrucomicrobia bacterium GWC2_42_7]
MKNFVPLLMFVSSICSVAYAYNPQDILHLKNFDEGSVGESFIRESVEFNEEKKGELFLIINAMNSPENQDTLAKIKDCSLRLRLSPSDPSINEEQRAYRIKHYKCLEEACTAILARCNSFTIQLNEDFSIIADCLRNSTTELKERFGMEQVRAFIAHIVKGNGINGVPHPLQPLMEYIWSSYRVGMDLRADPITKEGAIGDPITEEEVTLTRKFLGLLPKLMVILAVENEHVALGSLLAYIEPFFPGCLPSDWPVKNDAYCPYLGLLHIAAILGHSQSMNVLLNHRANTELTAGKNDMFNRPTPLILTAIYGNIDCMRLLLQRGAQVNATDDFGYSALTYAVGENKTACVRLLLGNRANPNICNRFDGWGPLHFAVMRKSLVIYDLLRKYGATLPQLKNGRTFEGFAEGVDGVLQPFVTFPPPQSTSKSRESLLEIRTERPVEEIISKASSPSAASSSSSAAAASSSARFRFDEIEDPLVYQQKIEEETKGHLQTESGFFVVNEARINRLRAQIARGKRRQPADVKLVNVQGLPARHVISADAGSVLMGGAFPLNPISSTDKTSELLPKLGFDNVPSVEYGAQGPKQQVIISGITITYVSTPNPKQLGNVCMFGCGSYGEQSPSDILAVINKITTGDSNKEKSLASFMLEYLKSGKMPSEYDLMHCGLSINRSDYKSLVPIFYLTLIKEISRRLPSVGFEERFPFGFAIERSLYLIRGGHLTMKDVFDKDAEYGLPTGQGVTSNPEAIENAKEKLKKLYRLYADKISSKTQDAITPMYEDPYREIFSTEQGAREELQQAFDREPEKEAASAPGSKQTQAPSSATEPPSKTQKLAKN